MNTIKFDLSKYTYTKGWFINSELHRNLHKFTNTHDIYNVLEIGCFEGLSACFLSTCLLNNKLSTLDCVDPYITSGTDSEITSQCISDKTYERFLQNIKNSNNYEKTNFHRLTSDDFFIENKKEFNFIYVDGCHEPDYLTRDVENSFNCLKINGIMWMNNYGGGKPPGTCKKVIDNALTKYTGMYEIIHNHYQLVIKKTKLREDVITRSKNIKTMVVTLPRLLDRRKHIENLLKVYNFSDVVFTNGIDGSTCTKTPVEGSKNLFRIRSDDGSEILYNSNYRNGIGLNVGEIGCAWSHINIYKTLVNDDSSDVYLVLEDDIEFSVDKEELREYINNLPPTYSYDLCHINKSTWFPFKKNESVLSVNDYYYTPHKKYFNNAGAYFITKAGAKKVLESITKSFGVPADDLLSNTNLSNGSFRLIVPSKCLVGPGNMVSSIVKTN